MLKRESFYIVAVFLVAVFMTAGCAKQDVVKKDEGIVPAPAARQVDQPKSNVTPSEEATTTPVMKAGRQSTIWHLASVAPNLPSSTLLLLVLSLTVFLSPAMVKRSRQLRGAMRPPRRKTVVMSSLL